MVERTAELAYKMMTPISRSDVVPGHRIPQTIRTYILRHWRLLKLSFEVVSDLDFFEVVSFEVVSISNPWKLQTNFK